MGTMQHHAIIVTGWNQGDVETAHALACNLTATDKSSPIRMSPVNAYYSFTIYPDGSKEGWPASDLGDDIRERFLSGIAGLSLTWVEVSFGELGLWAKDSSGLITVPDPK